MSNDETPSLSGEERTSFLSIPKLPVAGFWIRFFALLIDMILLILAIWTISRSMLPLVLQLGEYYPYVTGSLMFFYFALLNSKFGKGKTIGKLLFKLQVTDYAGEPITLRQSIIRTAVLFPAFVLIPISAAVIGTPESLIESYLRSLIGYFPLIAVLLTTLIIIPFNPFKQGFHDYLAQSLVRPATADISKEHFDEMTERIGYSWPKFYRQPQMSGLITFAMIMGVLAFLFHPGRLPESVQQFEEKRFAMKSLPGFGETDITYSPVKTTDYLQRPLVGPFRDQEMESEAMGRLPQSKVTTGTLSLTIEVRKQTEWKTSPLSEEREAANKQLAAYYYNEVLPDFWEYFMSTESSMAKDFATEIAEKPIELNVVFYREVSSAPPVFIFRNPIGVFTEQYPPLNLSMNNKSEMIE